MVIMMALTSERNFDQDCASLHRSDIIILFIFLSFKRPRLPHVTVGFWLKWGGTLGQLFTFNGFLTWVLFCNILSFLLLRLVIPLLLTLVTCQWGISCEGHPISTFWEQPFSSLINFHVYEPHREETPILALKLWSLSDKRTHLSSNCVTESQWISLFTSPWVLLGNWDVPDGSVA